MAVARRIVIYPRRFKGAPVYFTGWNPARTAVRISRKQTDAARLDAKMAARVMRLLAKRLPADAWALIEEVPGRVNPVHTGKWDRCVADVKAKGEAVNPYAICSASLGERASVRAAHRRKNPGVKGFVSYVVTRDGTRLYMRPDGTWTENGALAGVYATHNAAALARGKKARPVRNLVEYGEMPARQVLRARNAARGDPAKDTKRAARLYKQFHGNAPHEVVRVTHDLPHAAVDVGRVDAIEYTTTREGKVEHYRHDFDPDKAPDLAAGANGYPLFFIGGKTTFTDRGIEDK